jgi:hypothetical protein
MSWTWRASGGANERNSQAAPQKACRNSAKPKGVLTNVSKYSRGQKWPETRQLIAESILSWRQFATALIEASPDKKPEADVLDRARAAAQVLKQLDRVEIYLRLIERDFADRSGPILTIVHAALLLATRVHQLTIVDNEIDIASTVDRRRFLKDNRTVKTNKVERQRDTWRAKAGEIWGRHPDWSKSAVAKEITKTDPSAKVGTIRRQITKRQK